MIPFKMVEVPWSEWSKIKGGDSNASIIRLFQSDRFLVQVRIHKDAIRLSVNKFKWSNVDEKILWEDGITWDELQEIKDQCGFKDKWLCEYYPPKHKIINISNIRHLWVLDEDPPNSLDKY